MSVDNVEVPMTLRLFTIISLLSTTAGVLYLFNISTILFKKNLLFKSIPIGKKIPIDRSPASPTMVPPAYPPSYTVILEARAPSIL